MVQKDSFSNCTKIGKIYVLIHSISSNNISNFKLLRSKLLHCTVHAIYNLHTFKFTGQTRSASLNNSVSIEKRQYPSTTALHYILAIKLSLLIVQPQVQLPHTKYLPLLIVQSNFKTIANNR
jgi:hypothetical protein